MYTALPLPSGMAARTADMQSKQHNSTMMKWSMLKQRS